MQSLNLILKQRGEQGEALPSVFRGMDLCRAYQRRGTLSLIVAAPGCGKSALAAYIAVNSMYDEMTGVPSLYWSADTDEYTLASRIAAGLMGIEIEDAEYWIAQNDKTTWQALEKGTEHVWWCFNTSPTLRDVGEEVEAYAHVYGDYPHLIVIDNLVDVHEPGTEYERFRNAIVALDDLARYTQAHVMVLHHLVGSKTNGNTPPSREDILMKIDQKPRLILGLYRPTEGVMGVCVLKNTSGQADATGGFGFDLAWWPSRSWFSEGV